jgi:hypothetical protein
LLEFPPAPDRSGGQTGSKEDAGGRDKETLW